MNNHNQTNNIPHIYIACLASYNNGILHGCWIDATQEAENIRAEISHILKESSIPGAEDWTIHAIDNFGSLIVSESNDLEDISEKAQFIFEHGALGAEIIDHYNGHLEDAKEAIQDCYHGEWGSAIEYAVNLFDELYLHDIPQNIRHYIDYDAFARDIFINDYFFLKVEGKIHVFSYH